MNGKLFCVITTIQKPTPSVRKLGAKLKEIDAKLVVAGDQKGPVSYELENAIFLSLSEQLESSFELARKLPVCHYGRKNVGYLDAVLQGAECIYETDDDNAPLPWWGMRREDVEAVRVYGIKWVNVYGHFTEEKIWPRGFPLDEVMAYGGFSETKKENSVSVKSPVQQGLVNNSPDVDAVWRLIMDKPFEFNNSNSIYLQEGSWCPFNSQSTWWWHDAYPLLYLPSYCSFRMTDIWRSFIAQRCLWEMDTGVVFHAPEVRQDRNPHNLMRDFADELPGYTRNKELISVLEGVPLKRGSGSAGSNLLKCYEALVKAGFFPAQELILANCWLEDLRKALKGL